MCFFFFNFKLTVQISQEKRFRNDNFSKRASLPSLFFSLFTMQKKNELPI